MKNLLEQWADGNSKKTIGAENEEFLTIRIRRRNNVIQKLEEEKRDAGPGEKLIISNGEEALIQLIRNTIPIGISYARKYASKHRNSSLSYEDLEQEACMGIIHAASMYDPEKGARFSSYAVFWIEQYIRRALEDKGDLIRKPASAHSRARMIRRYAPQMPAAEVAKLTGIPESEVKFLRSIDSIKITSLDDGMTDDEESESFHEMIADPTDVTRDIDDRILRDQLHAVIRSMKDDRNRMIMELHLGLTQNNISFSNRQISTTLGIKVPEVSRVIRKTEKELSRWAWGGRQPFSI